MPPPNNRLHQLIRFVVFNLVRLFYPRIEVRGAEHLPVNRPILFVLNHPNGLIDPLILMIGLKQKVAFLGKSTLFGNLFGKTVMEAFGALPVYRPQDDGLPGGARGDAKERNEVVFAHCRALLGQFKALALFPEGTTHSDPMLRPMRSGAARIALQTEEEGQWQRHVQLAPVALWYESKAYYRSSVLVVIGTPFELTAYADLYAADPKQTIKEVTQRIEEGLDRVVLQAENADLLAAVPILAAWTAPQGERLTLAQQYQWSVKLLSLYEELQESEPERLAAFTQEAREYAKTLYTLGINDPWALHLSPAKLWRLIWLVGKLILTFPFALGGFILGYLPYRLAGPVATRVAPDDTQISTFKLIFGSIFVLLGWIAEAFTAGKRFGKRYGTLLFLSAPPLAYITLRWDEEWRELRQFASCQWLRLQRGQLINSLIKQRQSLAKQVMEEELRRQKLRNRD